MIFSSHYKLDQAAEMLAERATIFTEHPLLVITESWFGNNGLLKPLRTATGERVHLLSRLRCNAALYAQPTPAQGQQRGRPRKYGPRLRGVGTRWDD